MYDSTPEARFADQLEDNSAVKGYPIRSERKRIRRTEDLAQARTGSGRPTVAPPARHSACAKVRNTVQELHACRNRGDGPASAGPLESGEMSREVRIAR